MPQTITATYEHGVFVPRMPINPLKLNESSNP